MSEEGFNIDQAGEEFEQARQGRQQQEPPEKVPPEKKEGADGADGEKPGKEDPPGFMSYQEWVDAGKDPDDYRGRKAFESEHDRIKENKRLRRELKETRETTKRHVDALDEWQQRERKNMRAQIEAELKEAKENEDVDGALEAQRKLDSHEAEEKGRPPPPKQEHHVIQDFRAEHPELDRESEDFDEKFNKRVERYFNAEARALTNGFKEALDDDEIEDLLNAAMRKAQELTGRQRKPDDVDPDDGDRDGGRGESARNQRRAGQGNRRRGAQGEPAPRAENFVIPKPRNERQANAATEVRDLIKEKYGEDEAKTFERNLLS